MQFSILYATGWFLETFFEMVSARMSYVGSLSGETLGRDNRELDML